MEPLSRSMLSRVAALTNKKFRREEGKLVVEGWRILADALEAGALETVIVQAGAAKSETERKILSEAQKKNIPVYEIKDEDVRRISSTVTSPGVFGVARFDFADAKELAASAAGAPLLFLYEIGDPGNLGTILRTAHALGAGGVILSPGSCDPTNAKAVRSSMGAIFRIPVAAGDDVKIFESTRAHGYKIAATAPPGITLPIDVKQPEALRGEKKVLIVLGSEPRGLPEQIIAASDFVITVPQAEDAESLNIAAVSAILLYIINQIN